MPPGNGRDGGVNEKKKKKKGKGKGKMDSVTVEDEDDDIPPLEPPRATSRTGLSPELESVHLSTTASLSASAFWQDDPATREELLATAEDLYRTMGLPVGTHPGHPRPPARNGGGEEEYADFTDEEEDPVEYHHETSHHTWASLPTNVRNFVRNSYAQVPDRVKAEALYSMMMQPGLVTRGPPPNSRSTTNGHHYGAAAGHGAATYQSIPFDPSIFSDPAFNAAMEQAAAAIRGVSVPMPVSMPMPQLSAQYGHGHLPPSGVVLVNEIGPDGEAVGYVAEDEFYDEDPDGGGRHHHPHVNAHITVSYDMDPGYDLGDGDGEDGEGDEPSRKKKKKKRAGRGPAPAPVPDLGYDAAIAPLSNGVSPAIVPRPPLPLANAMSPARSTTTTANSTPAPLPSSRAAGKQPMTYTAAQQPAAAPVPPAANTRTARAASKQPIPAHAYPPQHAHAHPHHHPSPPSSNGTTPQKHRPPAGTTAGPGASKPPSNSKIWSTSSSEERERIKEFWLGLGEEERRVLVKVEKEAVLKKMKEQQKHNCSCAVCGRKRSVLFLCHHPA
jgi:hypothetical protein